MAAPAFDDEIVVEKRFRVPDADSKLYDSTEGSLRTCREALKSLRKENKELKAAVSSLNKTLGDANDQTIQETEIGRLDEQVVRLRKRFDDVRQNNVAKKAELSRLRQKLQDIDKQSQPLLTEDCPLAYKIRMLENRLDQSMIKYNEAQSIRRTYEQIVKRLKGERVGFNNQLAAIERTLKAKDHDYQELLNMSHDANHAKELAKAELAQFRAAYEEERRQKDKELLERKQYVQSRIDQTQKLERREKYRRQQELEAQQKVEEEKLRSTGLQADSSFSQLQTVEEQEKLTQYEEAFHKIKEATGVSDVHEVIQKFISQEETHRQLVQVTTEAQAKVDQLNTERNELRTKLEELKYSGPGHLSSRRIVDEFETHLLEAQQQCDKNRQKYERIARLLITAKAGIENLHEKLSAFKSEMPPIAMSDDTVVDILKQCESKLLLLMEESLPTLPGTEAADFLAVLDVPSSNRRIKFPASDEDNEDEQGEDEEEEEEDVLDRETVKKLASIAVARETKKLKKRKAKGRHGDD